MHTYVHAQIIRYKWVARACGCTRVSILQR